MRSILRRILVGYGFEGAEAGHGLDVGKGTGQGLAISRSIVEDKHGGSLSFDSEVGRGTRFLIKLPVEATASQQPLSLRRTSLAGSTSS